MSRPVEVVVSLFSVSERNLTSRLSRSVMVCSRCVIDRPRRSSSLNRPGFAGGSNS